MPNINVRFFLLIPKYSDVFYKENEKGYITKCYGTKLLLSDKYKKINYDKICNYFSAKNIGIDQYFTDFLKTINKLTNKTDCLYESKIAKALNAIYNPSNENGSNQ